MDWSDNPETDLAWYTVYRAESSGGPYSELASGLSTSTYVDSTAVNGTMYFYVVTATDTTGNESATSEEVTAVPSGPPVPVVHNVYAVSETTVEGSILSGDLTATLSSDDVYEALTEQHGGGRPSKRVSSLDHRWTFEIGNPDNATLIVEARRALNPDGDDFAVEYSTDGTSFLPLLVIDSAGDSILQADLPEGTGGTVVIRVIDTDRTPGIASLDTVFIDELLLRTMSGSSGMPRVSVSATDPTAAEAGPDPGAFTLTRSNTDGVLTVGIGLTGSAVPADYVSVGTSIDFPEGASTVTVVITPIDDANTEGPELIVLTVLPGSGYEVEVPDWAEVTIVDDDALTEDNLAVSETTVQGSAAGGLDATFAADNDFEVIIEESQAGGKRSRLEHQWTFDVSGGATTVVFSVEAFRSSDSDLFVFAYSTDGASWTDMITVTKTTDDDSPETFTLPSGISGTVYIRVQDTDHGRDDPVLSSISIDHLLIRSS